MKAKIVFFISLLMSSFSCASADEVNRTVAHDHNGRVSEIQNTVNNIHGSPANNSNSLQDLKNKVVFDGQNFIKKNGWRIPSYDDTHIGENIWNDKPIQSVMENGKTVKVVGKCKDPLKWYQKKVEISVGGKIRQEAENEAKQV